MPTPAVAASFATISPAPTPPAAAPPAAAVPLPDAAPADPLPAEAEPDAGAGGAGDPPPGAPLLPLLAPPSRILLGSALGRRLIGIGNGRLRADFASCSADIAWYMSKPMKLIAL